MMSKLSNSSIPMLNNSSQIPTFGISSHIFPPSNKYDFPPYCHNNQSTYIFLDGKPQPIESIVALVNSLRREVAVRSEQVVWLESELQKMRCHLAERDRDVDQLKSVLDQKLVSPHLLTDKHAVDMLQDEAFEFEKGEAVNDFGIAEDFKPSSSNNRIKKQGVCGESGALLETTGFIHHTKDDGSKQLIRDAITNNDFLKHLEPNQIEEIVECVYEKRIEKGCYIIREGEPGDGLYVSADGILEVSKNNEILGRMNVGKAFGEMALLYNCNRTASVKAITNARFWALDRQTYQQIMILSYMNKHEENMKFILSVPEFVNLSKKKLHKLVDVLEEICQGADEYIIRQGEIGETFFIIKTGKVQVTQCLSNGDEPREIRHLGPGDWFGERALYTLERRSANVIALTDVKLLSLDRSNFINLIGDLNEIKSKEYDDVHMKTSIASSGDDFEDTGSSFVDKKESPHTETSACPHVVQRPGKLSETVCSEIMLEDLERVAILGFGGFGYVELVLWKRDKTRAFALKCMNKKHIVETNQQAHIFSERNLMAEINNKFICRLYATYRDSKYVYMCLEACLGGELWTLLRNRGNFDENTTRFIIASVLEAFTYLHTRGIVYRDLKPENLLLDDKGYIKLCDFGFAKKIGVGKKTWTFCGTPEYVAPEIILNKGHDHSVDYWSLGVLTFELLNGSPPFSGLDPMKIYNMILRGIDGILFPPFKISRTASAIIYRLCVPNPIERLGYGRGGIIDIKQHKFFQGFDWIGLLRGTLIAPIIPNVKGPSDASNFDSYMDVYAEPPDEESGWDADF